ncbi:unnamed protein product [Polarella glacialis]|uniref:Uncharacterized protein n=1 Tax=Polarella glacialis TaxID=89957 RepID=A0A813DSX3_POLGL|nr:unnamed protein product [Polarella glacialis]CAE8591023.1 unnamed protein product [Polarella glacialis]
MTCTLICNLETSKKPPRVTLIQKCNLRALLKLRENLETEIGSNKKKQQQQQHSQSSDWKPELRPLAELVHILEQFRTSSKPICGSKRKLFALQETNANDMKQ